MANECLSRLSTLSGTKLSPSTNIHQLSTSNAANMPTHLDVSLADCETRQNGIGACLLLRFSFTKLKLYLCQAHLTLAFVNDPAGAQSCISHSDNQSESMTLETITPETRWLIEDNSSRSHEALSRVVGLCPPAVVQTGSGVLRRRRRYPRPS